MIESLLLALCWWLALTALGAAAWTALRPALSQWHDAGWALARTLGPLAFAYAFWLAGHALPVFDESAIRFSAIAVILAAVAWRRRWTTLDQSAVARALRAEIRFAAPFALYCTVRGFSHDIIGLEKFMDFSFVNAALATASLPVPDPWYAGEPINYYYFGHFATALFAKLTGTPGAFAYNLMLATIFAATFSLAYAIVAQLARGVARNVSVTMAFVAATWLTIGGNLHGFLYGFVKPWLVDAGLVERPAQAFLLSDPTRFVGWDPPTGDRLIHEFPAYAFYVGDLHAHLINLPWVLLFVAVLLAWRRVDANRQTGAARAWLACAAWLVGVFAASNAWDALMYAALLGAVLLERAARALARRRGGMAAIGDGLMAGAITAASAATFLLHFETMAQGFGWTRSHTPAWQWLVLYGSQLALTTVALFTLAAQRDGCDRSSTRFVVLLALAGLAFALVPEVVYLRDIYGDEFYRANTAFKFGFQAFTLLTLAACAGVALAVPAWSLRVPRWALVVVLEVALVPPLYYAWFVAQGAFGVWRERTWTLDGQRYLALSHPEDHAVVAWMRTQADTGATLIEAPGDSYTFGARISTNTGTPAVLGWPVHEQLWRGSSPEVWARRDDIERLYRARTLEDARAVAQRYGARWLVVGRFERERYPELDAQLLRTLGCVVFEAGETFVVDLKTRGTSGACARGRTG